jgi:hypothetical protein
MMIGSKVMPKFVKMSLPPLYVIVSRIRNILMPVGSLDDDDWFKSYAHICEKFVCIFCDLDRGPIFTKCVIYHAFN